MRNLFDINDLYDFQGTCLLCEIKESRLRATHKMHGFNPRRCNSASTFSCFIERNTSKVIITLPTNNDTVEVFENALTGGFSYINTRFGFDTEILISNYSRAEFDKMIISDSFKFYKRRDIKLDAEKTYNNRRITSSILKLDENNQYSYPMTKSLPTGCNQQQKKVPTWKEFNSMM